MGQDASSSCAPAVYWIKCLFRLGLTLVAVLMTVLAIWSYHSESFARTNPIAVPVAATTQPPEPEPPPSVVQFLAVGDNLIHKSLYSQAAARAKDKQGYDFAPAYAQTAKIIQTADLAFLNQESPIAGALRAPSSYPLFNTPTQAGDAVYDLGFRAISLSNNHMLDQGVQGVEASLSYWESKEGVVTFGAYRNETEFQQPRVLDVNGIRFGFVGATFSYNGLQLPANRPLVLPLLHQEALLKESIATARANADVVVVSLHWGDEDSRIVNTAQRQLAQKCADFGADVILGTHPHVLQSLDVLTAADGRSVLVAYSLGNFISAQNKAPNLIGGCLRFSVKKTKEKIKLGKATMIPVITHYENRYQNIRLIPWKDYTPALAKAHGVLQFDRRFTYEYIKTLLEETFPGQISS